MKKMILGLILSLCFFCVRAVADNDFEAAFGTFIDKWEHGKEIATDEYYNFNGLLLVKISEENEISISDITYDKRDILLPHFLWKHLPEYNKDKMDKLYAYLLPGFCIQIYCNFYVNPEASDPGAIACGSASSRC